MKTTNSSVYNVNITAPDKFLHLEYNRLLPKGTKRVDIYGPGPVDEDVIDLMTNMRGACVVAGDGEQSLSVFGLGGTDDIPTEREHLEIVLGGIHKIIGLRDSHTAFRGHDVLVHPRALSLLRDPESDFAIAFEQLDRSIRANLLNDPQIAPEGQVVGRGERL